MTRIAHDRNGPVRVLLCGSFAIARLAAMANG
jgi:hypothetical protein